eukprot:1686078-Pyramimonas_sp.AAC.1
MPASEPVLSSRLRPRSRRRPRRLSSEESAARLAGTAAAREGQERPVPCRPRSVRSGGRC